MSSSGSFKCHLISSPYSPRLSLLCLDEHQDAEEDEDEDEDGDENENKNENENEEDPEDMDESEAAIGNILETYTMATNEMTAAYKLATGKSALFGLGLFSFGSRYTSTLRNHQGIRPPSFNLIRPDDCFISFDAAPADKANDAAPAEWSLEGGSSILFRNPKPEDLKRTDPRRLYFENVRVSTCNMLNLKGHVTGQQKNIFQGDVDWGNNHRWEYELHFTDNLLTISSAAVNKFDGDVCTARIPIEHLAYSRDLGENTLKKTASSPQFLTPHTTHRLYRQATRDA